MIEPSEQRVRETNAFGGSDVAGAYRNRISVVGAIHSIKTNVHFQPSDRMIWSDLICYI